MQKRKAPHRGASSTSMSESGSLTRASYILTVLSSIASSSRPSIGARMRLLSALPFSNSYSYEHAHLSFLPRSCGLSPSLPPVLSSSLSSSVPLVIQKLKQKGKGENQVNRPRACNRRKGRKRSTLEGWNFKDRLAFLQLDGLFAQLPMSCFSLSNVHSLLLKSMLQLLNKCKD